MVGNVCNSCGSSEKIAIYILGDEKKRGKLFVLIGSIAVGFIGLMCLPVAVLSSMGSMEIEQPEINAEMFSDSALFESLDSEQQAKITEIQNSGQEIEDAMSGAGVRSQTIKAQLIYMSYFDDVQNFNAQSYANLFAVAPNDSDLIAAINSTYGLEIDYDEFMRTYTWVMNSTINEYMFTDRTTKIVPILRLGRRMRTSQAGDLSRVQSEIVTMLTASDMLIMQGLCLVI